VIVGSSAPTALLERRVQEDAAAGACRAKASRGQGMHTQNGGSALHLGGGAGLGDARRGCAQGLGALLVAALVLTLGGGASASSKGVYGRARGNDVGGRLQEARPLAIYSARSTGLACCARVGWQCAWLGLCLRPCCPREKQDGAERWIQQFNEKKARKGEGKEGGNGFTLGLGWPRKLNYGTKQFG
jgi:hypothetical protein